MEIRKLSFGLFACIVLTATFPVRSNANTLLYTFSTTNGVAGSFTLDDSTPFNVAYSEYGDCCGNITQSVFSTSEMGPISGTFGEYSFSGPSQLRVRNALSPYLAAYDLGQADFWYLTAFVSGTEVNGKALTFLGMYEDLRPETDLSNLFAPRPPTPQTSNSHYDNFFYIARYSDGTDESGQLETLSLVPEPSSLFLLLIGLTGVIAAKSKIPATHKGSESVIVKAMQISTDY